MKVLSLVSNRFASFYVKQAEILNNYGVDLTHVSPRKQSPVHDIQVNINRTIIDYSVITPKIWGRFFDDFDLVHGNNGKMGPFALAQPHRPIILTLWGADLLGASWLKTGLTKHSAVRSSEVIVRSEEMLDELPCDAHVIPAGVDLEVFQPMDRDVAASKVGWEASTKNVLFPYPPSQTKKNFPVAKQIVEQVNKDSTNRVELRVVTGINHEQMPLYFNAADVLLLPSDHEGSPNTVKEAMACNLPIISTDVGDVAQRLTHVQHSYVCDDWEEMIGQLKIVLETNERSDGRKYVEDVSLEKMGERILEVYEKALS